MGWTAVLIPDRERDREREPTLPVLDFVVVGAPHAGVGWLSRALMDHPQVALPAGGRPAPWVDSGRYVFGPEWFEPGVFEARRGVSIRGLVDVGHMSGHFSSPERSHPLEELVGGMIATLPNAKLIAVLRDPIARAIAHHRSAQRHGLERRSLERALHEQLSSAALHAARLQPREATGYITWGEYGRILDTYREHYPKDQLLVLFDTDLRGQPQRELSRIAGFLEIEDSWSQPSEQHEDEDSQRLSQNELQDLLQTLQAHLPAKAKHPVNQAIAQWNTIGETDTQTLPPELEARLHAHYHNDTQTLVNNHNLTPPWQHAYKPAHVQTISADRPRSVVPEHHATVERIATEIASALHGGRGFSLIRIGADEAALLTEEMWPGTNGGHVAHLGGPSDPGAAATAIRSALAQADAVGMSSAGDGSDGSATMNRLLFHFQLAPQLRCSAQIDQELLALDSVTGRVGISAPLLKLLRGRPIALVGPRNVVDWAMWRRQEELRAIGLDVRLSVHLDDFSDLDNAVFELAGQRELYDAVIVIGDAPGKPLCTRLADELDVVALDIGHSLDRTLHPRYIVGAPQLSASAYAAEYLRQRSQPGLRLSHELDGKLIRAPGKATVYYVERGHRRALTNRSLLELFADPPIEVPTEVVESLSQGVPLFAVHERFTGTFVLIDGRKRPLHLGIPFTVADDVLELTVSNRPIHWYPGAGEGLAGRKR